MTWQETLHRLRSRIPLRLIGRLALALVAATLTAIGVEAVVRAHLEAPLDRVPTALYTRPVPWGRDGGRGTPVALGSVNGTLLERRIPVTLREVPDHLIQAILAVEDQRFYRHHGLDVKRIGGAMVANIKAGGIIQGGSTLTQQLSKNLFLSAGRTPLRKLREAAISVVLEMRYDKAAILTAYLNEIYLGQDGGRAIHGVGGAARYYFGTDVRKLSLAESALLAGMISAPNRYAPSRNPEAARQRRDLVLQLMAAQGRITKPSAERAGRTRVLSRSHPAPLLDGRWFRDFALAGADHHLPERGVAVYTTLDATLQRAAERAVQIGLGRFALPGIQAALVAIDPRTGEVLAMVGGRDYGASQFNRATEARRQPGSAFKPVVALAALERHEGQNPDFTLASQVDDEPLQVRTAAGLWQPSNYDQQFRGRVTVREAMEQSLNVPFARIGLAVGPRRIVEMARQLGITSPLAPVPSLALGSSEVTLLELVRAYGVFAAAGSLAAPRVVLGQGRYGTDIRSAPIGPAVQVVDPAAAYLVTSALEGVVTRGTGRALNAEGRFEAIAGKTGTSNQWRDAWFIAYSPALVVGVWVGFDDGQSLRMSGATAALPITARFLAEAAGESDWGTFERPDGITESYVSYADGGWDSECGMREVFLEGTEPQDSDCGSFRLPNLGDVRDWGGALERRAARLFEGLLHKFGRRSSRQ